MLSGLATLSHAAESRVDRWCRQEQERLARDHVRLVRAISSVAAHWVPLAVVVGVVVCSASVHRQGDFEAFAEAGLRSMHGRFDAFQASYIQVGPFYVLLLGIGAAAGRLVGVDGLVGAAVVTGLVMSIAVVAAVRACGLSSRAAELLAGATLLLGGAVAVAADAGHPEEALIILLLVVATRHARQERGTVAGALLGAAVAVKLWPIAAVGLLLVLASWRQRLLGLTAALAVPAVCYLPFVTAGRIATFDFGWTVQSPAPISLVMGDAVVYGYRERLLQVTVTTAVGAALALRHRSDRVVWALPLAVGAVRLLLDPLPSPYYWAPVIGVLLLGVFSWRRTLLQRAIAVFVLDIVLLLLVAPAAGVVGALALTGLGLLMLGFAPAPLVSSRVTA